MLRILKSSFFNRPTLKVSRELLGKFLVRRIGGREMSGMIMEVEAYVGPRDRASHASHGKTKRTEVMFGRPGYWYVYVIYGVYHCLNIVTERENYPAAILIRSVLISQKKHSDILENVGMFFGERIAGPGRVCRYFKIDKQFNQQSADKKTGLWVEDRGVKLKSRLVRRGKRIGVDYAGEWKDKPWRFYI